MGVGLGGLWWGCRGLVLRDFRRPLEESGAATEVTDVSVS